MHKFTPLIAAAAVCAAAISIAGRTEAGALAGAEGLRPALDQMNITETVHCTPGIAHRRSPPRDGCYRRAYRAAPAYSYGYGPSYGYGGYPYGYYRPGFSVGVGVGGWGGHRGWGWGPGVGVGFGW
jgi:hypothetical protein